MGLSILAGALGLAFSNLDKLSEFSGAGFSAKMKDQVQAVIDKETEQADTSGDNPDSLSENEIAVLRALGNAKYTWRTLKGISGGASLSEQEVWETLLPLIEQNYVRTSNKRSTGEMIWSLTLRSLGYINA